MNIDILIDTILEDEAKEFEKLADIYQFLRKQITKARLIDIADDKALKKAIDKLSEFILTIKDNRKVDIAQILPSLEMIRKRLDKSDKIDHEDDVIYKDFNNRYNITVD